MDDDDEVPSTLALAGDIAVLAERIAAAVGTGAAADPALRAALARAFPELPAPDALEPCSTHPALLARFRVPALGRESVKAVFVPKPRGLEVRVRAELPGGSYRKETLLRIIDYAERISSTIIAADPQAPVASRQSPAVSPAQAPPGRGAEA